MTIRVILEVAMRKIIFSFRSSEQPVVKLAACRRCSRLSLLVGPATRVADEDVLLIVLLRLKVKLDEEKNACTMIPVPRPIAEWMSLSDDFASRLFRSRFRSQVGKQRNE